MRLIFETNDLSSVSPATISRCGIVHIVNENIEYDKIIDLFFETYKFDGHNYLDFVIQILK